MYHDNDNAGGGHTQGIKGFTRRIQLYHDAEQYLSYKGTINYDLEDASILCY